MKKGFSRLKGATVASAMGIGMLGGLAGSARAANFSTPANFSVQSGTSRACWGSYTCTETTNVSAIGNLNWAFNPAVTSTWSSSTAFAISDAAFSTSVNGTATNKLGDMYDSAFQVAVDGAVFANPDGNVDLTGNIMTTDTVTLNGLDTTIQLAFGNVYPGSLVVLYSFANNGGSNVDATIALGGNLGSDGNTVVQDTESGDATITMSDSWYTSNDGVTVGNGPSNDPVFTFCRFGDGASVIPTTTSIPGTNDGSGTPDNFVETYDITVPAGETRSILVFAFMSMTNAAASMAGPFCANASAAYNIGLVDGLNADNLAATLNYDFASILGGGNVGGGDDGSTPDYGPNTASSALGVGSGSGDNLGAWSWSLTGLLGLLGLVRRRRVKH